MNYWHLLAGAAAFAVFGVGCAALADAALAAINAYRMWTVR